MEVHYSTQNTIPNAKTSVIGSSMMRYHPTSSGVCAPIGHVQKTCIFLYATCTIKVKLGRLLWALGPYSKGGLLWSFSTPYLNSWTLLGSWEHSSAKISLINLILGSPTALLNRLHNFIGFSGFVLKWFHNIWPRINHPKAIKLIVVSLKTWY